MDQEVKQRIVGIVVITALAAIFVPMLFDEPIGESGKEISALKIPDYPVYAVNSVVLPETIEQVIDLPESLSSKSSSTQSRAQRSTSDMQRWFIQVGIFEQESNAISLQNILIKQGFPVIITPVFSEQDIFYRVRVGPELDEKRAEVMKAKISELNNINGMLAIADK